VSEGKAPGVLKYKGSVALPQGSVISPILFNVMTFFKVLEEGLDSLYLLMMGPFGREGGILHLI